MSVRRIFVEKKPEYAVRAKELRQEIENGDRHNHRCPRINPL